MSQSDVGNVELPTKRTEGETLADRLTENAYHNILPARYLKKDADGRPVEQQEDLFDRVAKNIALAEAVYGAEEPVTVEPDQVKPDHPRRGELAGEAFGVHSDRYTAPEQLPEDLDEAREHLATETTELTEGNVSKFAYDTVVPELDDDLREYVEEIYGEFRETMERLQFIPNSPTLMNAGDELQQLSACFVCSPEDDITDIHETAKEAAEVFQSGGGMGYAFWRLRPYGDPVGSTGGIASGPITFMRTYDQLCETIAQGGARRGAQMAVMRVSHPDIVQFVHAKNKDVSLARTLRLNDPDDYTHTSFVDALEEARDLIDDQGRVPEHLRNAVEGHLSNFNISVGVTDDFMDAVRAGEEYTFTNPNTGDPHEATQQTKELYERFGLGEHVEVGEPLSLPADVLWERIVDGAHENGEPGVVFLDRINEEHSFDVDSTPTGDSSEYEILATNPCGEQPLMEYEACNLGHINLSTLAATGRPDWRAFHDAHDGTLEEAVSDFLDRAIDNEELDRRIEVGTRFLDNVVTMSDFPVDRIERTVRDNRKVGLGIMGLAQLFIQLGVEYGSEAGNEVARQVMQRINHGSKRVSHDLAHQRGAFNNWDDSKWADPTAYAEWFEKQTGLSAEEHADGYPIRNHNTTTIAPTGTTSMVGNTSGGCEPIFNVAYYKNVSEDVQGDEMLVEFDDYFLRVLEANDIDVDDAKREAQELMANNEFDGVDSMETVPDAIGELFVTTGDLTAKEHAAVQCALQDGVDSAISKTVNATNDATLADAKEAFEYVHDNGGKGVTYYRDGTRSKQVLTTRAENTEFADALPEDDAEAAEVLIEQIQEIFGGVEAFLGHDVVGDLVDVEDLLTEHRTVADRPDTLTGVSQRIETGYGKLYVTINEDPETGEPFEVFANIGHSGGFTNSFTEAIGKITSSALRAGVPPEEIVDELCGTRSPKVAWDKGEQIQSIPDAIGTALRRYLDGDVDRAVPQQTTIDEVTDADSEGGEPTTASTSGDQRSDAADADGEIAPETDGGVTTRADSQAVVDAGENPECPECGAMRLYYSEGCKTCEACGWSEC